MTKRRGPGRIFTFLCCAAGLLAPIATQVGSTCPADPAMDKLVLPHFWRACEISIDLTLL